MTSFPYFRRDNFLLFLFLLITINCQRKMENLDRGIVAIPKTTSTIFISWRHFATDPDNIAYNVYYNTEDGEGLKKINSTPITKRTNLLAEWNITANTYTFYVKSVLNAVEKDEEGSFTVAKNTARSRIVRDFDFEPWPPGYPEVMTMKFCWPADLNGDGKYDFVLDRHDVNGVIDDAESDEEPTIEYLPNLVEAYTSEGKFLWRMSMGINVIISSGHDDMVTVYDMDGDGKAEVLVAISEGTTFADGTVFTGGKDSVTDYRKLPGSAPQWLAVWNGMTGAVLDIMELPLLKALETTRTDKWKHLGGHFIIAYLDGIHPSLIYQAKNRLANNNFQGGFMAFRFYERKIHFEWAKMFHPEQEHAEFHQVRAGDVDGDGNDEFIEGGYVLNNDGTLWNKHVNVYHGDRHTLADIDPDRPGLEHFFIQQTNVMGMGLADASTGEWIKGHYMTGAYDVGRGACAAFDPQTRGMQYFSTMESYAMYNSKGKPIQDGFGVFPAEPLWWGPSLSRYHVSGIGSGGYNLAFYSFYRTTTGATRWGRVTPNFYLENNGKGSYYFKASNGGRPAFWGDILGDWREEMVLVRSNDTGFVIVSTWDETPIRLYCLMQNPAYRVQTTAKGYYQTSDVDYYMAADMPPPPIPPVQKADMYYTKTGWINDQEKQATYSNGKSIMFDTRGGDSIYIMNEDMSPSRLWWMNPKGKDYLFTGPGKFTGPMDVIKSLQGNVTFKGNHDYTGWTRVSEGCWFINGTLKSKVQVDARGVIGGNARLEGGIIMKTGLNYEGGRIEPGINGELGEMSIKGDWTMPGRNSIGFEIDQTKAKEHDKLSIEGNFIIYGNNNNLIFKAITPVIASTLTLITFTGISNATKDNFIILGLEGIPNEVIINHNSIQLFIANPRSSTTITWTGAFGSSWGFVAKNFLNNQTGKEDIFVPGDIVLFTDDAKEKTVTIGSTSNLPIGGMIFDNSSDYLIVGDGVISGSGYLKKTGPGKLSLFTEENTFTGPVEIEGGTLVVTSIKSDGLSSSIGASSKDARNWIMKNAVLETAAKMSSDRDMAIQGTLMINNPTSDTSILLSGNIAGQDAILEVVGDGSLTLQGSNEFKEIYIKAGTLFLGSINGNTNGWGSAKITFSGGILKMYDSNTFSHWGPLKNEIYVPEGADVLLITPSRWNIEVKLTGNGIITINTPYTRVDFNGDWSEFYGVLKLIGSDFRFNSLVSRNIPNAVVEVSGSVYVSSASGSAISTSQSFTFGALSGTGSLSGLHSYTVGTNNIDTTFRGKISESRGNFIKVGTGILTISGSILNTGETLIKQGTLIRTGTMGTSGIFISKGATFIIEVDATTSSGAIEIWEEGTLTINGRTYKEVVNNGGLINGSGAIIGSVTSARDSTVAPGRSLLGKLTIEGNWEMQENSTLLIRTQSGANESDSLEITGHLNINDSVLEVMKSGTNSYFSGNKYTVFTSPNIEGTFKDIKWPTWQSGLIWNVNNLYSSGVLEVTQD